jgi:prepilin-type N-terminal cleavage/methylation domain-containing protein
MKKKQAGFSLIELLIVVAIILIIAAIAIPNLIRSKIAANEASAMNSLRTINTAQVAFAATYPSVGFASVLTALAGSSAICATPTGASSANACLIDPVLGSGTKAGYNFVVASAGATSPNAIFTANADPIFRGQSGQRSFFSDQSGVIRYNAAAASTIADTPIQ